MEGKYNDREFEQFLKENADNHRLYPSDEVWTKIHARLHAKKRWPLTSLLVLAFTVSSITWLASGDRSTEQATVGIGKPLNKQSVSIAPTMTQSTNDNLLTDHTTALADERSLDNEPLLTNENVVRTTTSAAEPITPTAATTIEQAEQPTPANAISSEINTQPLHNEEQSSVGQQVISESLTPSQLTASIRTDEAAQQPLTIESVTNSYQRQKHSPKFSWQFHFTPTISYRSLKEDQKLMAQARLSFSTAPSLATPTTDLKNSIRHRPDIGMQMGISGTYPIGKRVDFVAGLQFNVSKYDIKAFNYPTEVATIALVNSWSGPTAVSTLTSFRSNGFMNKASWLRNYYYSLSVPLGFEWRILGKKQNHWGINTSIQPTYVVGNRTYMISMDYQNYAEVPYLINKWNVNVGVETYAKFSIGQHDFRIGPQLRYQLFSSFKKGYPVSEHLYDFGIKLGMQLGK